MPRNYWIYQVTGFPAIELGRVWNVPYQFALLDEVGDGLKTEFTHDYTIDDMHTDAYRVLYEVVEKKAGRIGNTPFQQITAEYRFPAFVFRTEGLLVLQAKSSQARGVAKRLTHVGDGLTLDHSRVDLDAVMRIIPSITGAWLSVEDSADVTSQAFFGPSVDRDERFSRALGEGGLRYIYLPYE